MGFSPIPPKPGLAVLTAMLDLWTLRADAGILHVPPPWDSLLAGVRPDSLVSRNLLPYTNYYRSKGLVVFVTLDLTDGLDRSREAPLLIAAGRSLTEPAVQQLYRRYAVAIDSVLAPRYLGLAAETNLIRASAPPALYAAVVQAANGAAADVRARDAAVQLYASVQVEAAWGALAGGSYVGVATDLIDFPFMQALGLSTFPFLAGTTEPEQLPLDYYARLALGTSLPEIVVESGWPSVSLGTLASSPAKQARWLRHNFAMLDNAHAIGVFQLTFTDLDLTGVVIPPGSSLPLFASLGLADKDLVPKMALAAWDSAFARGLR